MTLPPEKHPNPEKPIVSLPPPSPNPSEKIAVCTLEYAHPSLLNQVLNDLRDRTDAAYREFFERLVADIGVRGVMEPIPCIRNVHRFDLFDGETRRRGALLAGVKTVPLLVFSRQLTPGEMKIASLQANAMRQDMTPLEYARVYFQLMSENKWDAATLSRNIHANPGTVCKRLSVLEHFLEELKQHIGEGDGKIPFTGAYAIARLADPDQQREVAKLVLEGRLCRDGIIEEVNRRLGKGKKKKAKAMKWTDGDASGKLPSSWGWNEIVTWLGKAHEAAKRGAKTPGMPTSAFETLLKTV